MWKSLALSQLLVASELSEENEWKEIWCRNGVFGVRTANPRAVRNNNSYLLSGVKNTTWDNHVGFGSTYGNVLWWDWRTWFLQGLWLYVGSSTVSWFEVHTGRMGKATQTFFFLVGRNTFLLEWILFSLPLVLNPLYIQYMILHLLSSSCKAYLRVCVSGEKGTLYSYNFSHKCSIFWLWI